MAESADHLVVVKVVRRLGCWRIVHDADVAAIIPAIQHDDANAVEPFLVCAGSSRYLGNFSTIEAAP